ncbi:MAG: phasin family protein [Pseudomonadota bacterium]
MENKSFEIPENMRKLAEQNIEQTRAAYHQFMEMAKQAQDLAANSQGAMLQSAIEIQTRALKFAEKNTEASFEFANDVARAKDVQQYVDIQTRYAQRQMQAYQEQAAQLGQLMSDVMRKAGTSR